MLYIPTGCVELDAAIGGGLPKGRITMVYSSLENAPFRRRLLCSIAEANESAFVDSTVGSTQPRIGAVWAPDIRSATRTLLGSEGISVVVVDPVEFELEVVEGVVGRRAQIIQRIMQLYSKLCSDTGKTLVLGWTRINRLPTGANYLSSAIIRVLGEYSLSIEKLRDVAPSGEIRINRLWHPSSNFDTTKSRFDIDLDID